MQIFFTGDKKDNSINQNIIFVFIIHEKILVLYKLSIVWKKNNLVMSWTIFDREMGS